MFNPQFHRHGAEPLRDDEINILNGVLELNTKRAIDIMTEMKVCVYTNIYRPKVSHSNVAGCSDP